MATDVGRPCGAGKLAGLTLRPAGNFIAACLLVATAASAAAQQSTPKIVPRDYLTITVLGVPDFSGKFAVDADGNITYPFLGRLKAAGFTASELEADLKKRLEGDYVINPQVRVEFEPIESKRVSITGAVKVPGELKFAGELRVFDALVKAGMTTADAGDEVLVVRVAPSRDGQTAGETEVISVSLRGMEKGSLTDNIPLQDGDHVRVSKGQLVTITGQVRSPGAYGATPGMTVRQALALAGDVTEKGTHRGLKILRKVAGKEEPQEIKNVKLEDIVQPGDTIIVARRIM
jgi:polysaccharide export outer membrane protein